MIFRAVASVAGLVFFAAIDDAGALARNYSDSFTFSETSTRVAPDKDPSGLSASVATGVDAWDNTRDVSGASRGCRGTSLRVKKGF